MADIKNLAKELAKLTSDEVAQLNTELGNLNVGTSVTITGNPDKLPPIGGGFPGDLPPIKPKPSKSGE